ncbi:MAG: tRNA preQ1(34) S-adenosylmethionine ribosyltransferase-isomerase QueA [Thermodesulfobacteriota bacterium]
MQPDFKLSDYDYNLPGENIAQHPADRRTDSRLLVLDRGQGGVSHKRFHDLIDLVKPGDLLVVNDTRVFPARLLGKKETGGKVEIFLLSFPALLKSRNSQARAEATALIKSSKRPKPASRITIESGQLECIVLELLDDGKARVELLFPEGAELGDILNKLGQVPLPPYIERQQGTTEEDVLRYQTVYADRPGAVAAPTAGLHFSDRLLDSLAQKGVQTATITLHVGYGTFAPVRCKDIDQHVIHREWLDISAETAEAINRTRQQGGSIWAVGTTTVRGLEFAASAQGEVRAIEGWCDLYITPGYRFKVIDHLITNFHLPQSSLLFLVSALCGRKTLLACYEEAIARGYRFYSYGDAMVIL